MSKIEKKYKVEGNILTVKVEIQKRMYKSEDRILLKTQDILQAVENETEYNIIETIKDCAGVSNGTKKATILNTGVWVFKVKKPRKRVQKAKPQQEKKQSIKSRMSNIAKKASQNKES